MADQQENKKAWTGKTGGTRRMQESLITIFRHVDVRWLYPLMWLWIAGYILFASSPRRGIWYYWRKRRGCSFFRSCLALVKNFCEFGKVILDRFAAYAGRKVNIRIVGQEIISSLNAREGGYIVLSTHIGNQELAGYSIRAAKPFHILTFMGDTATVNDNRRRSFEQMGLYMLPLCSDGSHVVEMHNVLSEGHVLSIHGDRLFYGGRTLLCNILGEEACFPEGPYRFAVLEGVPVITMFMMRERTGEYTLHVKQLSDGTYEAAGRKQQAQELLERYVRANEEILAEYPHQWYHFYEFWKK